MTTVTATDLKNNVESLINDCLKEPVFVTKHGKRVAVLLDAAELERLITLVDNRQSFFVKDLPADVVDALNKGPQGPSRPELDHLG